MCFEILQPQVPWSNRTVWKVVRLTPNSHRRNEEDHYLWSQHFYYRGERYQWHSGEHVLPERSITQRRGPLGRDSYRGFYVYRNHEVAFDSCTTAYHVVLRLTVDPKDFLFHSPSNEVATYRRVFVPLNQPYIEFLE